VNSAEVITALLGTGGGSVLIIQLVKGIRGWVSGRAGRDRERDATVENQRINAIAERDRAWEDLAAAIVDTRKAHEYSSQLRRQLFEAGIPPIDWPTK